MQIGSALSWYANVQGGSEIPFLTMLTLSYFSINSYVHLKTLALCRDLLNESLHNTCVQFKVLWRKHEGKIFLDAIGFFGAAKEEGKNLLLGV